MLFHDGQFFLFKRWPYLPGHHGLQTKVGNEALVVTFCIWLLWSPGVDLKTFVVAHMDEVLWLDDEGKFELEHKVTEFTVNENNENKTSNENDEEKH